MLDLTHTVYQIPCIDKPDSIIGVDITAIVKAEARLEEVATVSQMTAAELLTIFNKNWLDLHRMITALTYQKNKAENAYKKAKAESKLACNDEVIKAKGHTKASSDLREALSDLDPNVVQTKDALDELSVLVSYLKGKQDAFQKGYESVKKLIGANTLPLQYAGTGSMPLPMTFQVDRTVPLPHTQITCQTIDFEPLPEGFR
jgi:hypothetical protein